MRILFFTILFSILFTAFAHAATLSVTAPHGAVVGAQIPVDIVLSLEGEVVNSVEVSLRYPSEILTYAGYQEGAGVVKLWVEPPSEKQKGAIHFAGGVPGGIDGVYQKGEKKTSITIARLIFTPTTPGVARVEIADSALLLNDGAATPLPHKRQAASLSIDGSGDTTATKDTAPPLAFSLTLIPKDALSHTPQQVRFSAVDQESGIAGYEIKRGWGTWETTTSPAVAKRTFFSYTLRVRAIDTYGNEAISSLRIKGVLSPWILVLLVCSAGIVRFFMIKQKV